MRNNYKLASFPVCILGMLLLFTFSSCKKNLPDDRESLATDTRFTTTVYTPVLGRNTLFTDNFSVGNSSLPLDFKIVNMRTRDGSAAPELTELFPVKVWAQPYLGTEKSLTEIEAKRKTENHPLFEIREHSGQFLMWSAANSSFVKTQPDSGYVFDVEVSNTGGRRYFRDFKLMPLKERSFEPSIVDPITGLATYVGLLPSNVTNIQGERTGSYMFTDIAVLFNKVGNGNSLTFKFVDSLYQNIDPNKFNLTKWETLVHGFDMEKTNTYVKYKVAYPIPLSTYPTAYTNIEGNRASTRFAYERIGYGNIRVESSIRMDFSLFEEGDWEITFWFRGERPKFEND